MESKIANCPICKRLPDTEVRREGLRYLCRIGCTSFGCKYYFPVVTVSFSKNAAMRRAEKRWNKFVEIGRGTLDY